MAPNSDLQRQTVLTVFLRHASVPAYHTNSRPPISEALFRNLVSEGHFRHLVVAEEDAFRGLVAILSSPVRAVICGQIETLDLAFPSSPANIQQMVALIRLLCPTPRLTTVTIALQEGNQMDLLGSHREEFSTVLAQLLMQTNVESAQLINIGEVDLGVLAPSCRLGLSGTVPFVPAIRDFHSYVTHLSLDQDYIAFLMVTVNVTFQSLRTLSLTYTAPSRPFQTHKALRTYLRRLTGLEKINVDFLHGTAIEESGLRDFMNQFTNLYKFVHLEVDAMGLGPQDDTGLATFLSSMAQVSGMRAIGLTICGPMSAIKDEFIDKATRDAVSRRLDIVDSEQNGAHRRINWNHPTIWSSNITKPTACSCCVPSEIWRE